MGEAYICLDVHKERIVIGLWHAGEAILHGSCSADLDRFMKALRGMLKKS